MHKLNWDIGPLDFMSACYLSFCLSAESIFHVFHVYLLAEILPLLRPFGYANLSNEVLAQLLLYGDENLPNNVNRNILELTLQFIKETGRLD